MLLSSNQTITDELLSNGTEFDLTNSEHIIPSLTLIMEKLTINDTTTKFYTIKNYKTNQVHKHFHTLAETVKYINNRFRLNFKTI
jgi:hypothetical protein